ncbi:cysteinyl-tRNA ligase [Mycoplasma wenyonii str. Massachusetts]|uniref:Cysteinyl-tRNA ligase n=1 Tax=Mycoplasma wenyonii (strain Massachusetts) TaxID=1197325 RepID=I6Z650_MYCWM|nr:class I tRNA ligase family protein [Mycoplasma wenyonii]AFN65053.1 cysteinyl-tRNA ligase [Mycoplasma wenyonii str. Massachusetts]
MSLKLFDTLSQTNKYLPEKQLISIYVCGPTLYNYLHLGNLRPIVIFDFLIRYLRYKELDYKYVQNLTDIDEKIFISSQEKEITASELTSQFSLSFFNIYKKLNLIQPDLLPRVSEHLSEIKWIISSLISRNQAYWDKSSQTVKFLQPPKDKSLNYFTSYEEELSEETNFALWKENVNSKEDYESPWFRGIPGWHIECFAMLHKYFELPITIHGGGVDLKFPHHENVNLLSRTACNCEIADIWVHIGQVLNEEGKLSKSSNFSWKVEECASLYSWELLRYLFLKARYNKPQTITKANLDNYWAEWKSFISALNYAQIILSREGLAEEFHQDIQELDERFISCLENDLNLPEVLSCLENWKQLLLNAIKSQKNSEIALYRKTLSFHLSWLGFTFPKLSQTELNEAKTWFDLVESKEYQQADLIRSKLQEKLIIP